MSCPITFPRQVLQRLSDRKNRKLAVDDSDNITVDHDFDFVSLDSRVQVVEDSQSSSKQGYFDLFDEIIAPIKSVSEPVPKTKFVKKTPVSRKKKKSSKKLLEDSPVSVSKPQKKFIPTPRIISIMKEGQTELYSLMGLNQSSSDISIVSNDSPNVSGVQCLLDSPTSSVIKKSNTNTTNINNEKYPVLEGVVAFVDYKIDQDRSGLDIIQQLIEMGAKVEKTFNIKVTHVVFCDGYRNTYTKAIERNIPLVSAKWLNSCKSAHKILDPVDYPPINIEKYSKTPEFNFNIPKLNTYKCLKPSNVTHDQILKTKCDKLVERINNIQLDHISETEENCDILIPHKAKPLKEQEDELYRPNDVISILSDHLQRILNTKDSPILDKEVIDDLCVPMSIKIIRKFLTPEGKENESFTELNNELLKIEDRLKLNSKARQRFRKLLFPLDNDISIVSDFPSPSPQKLRISAPGRLISTKKKVVDKIILPHRKNDVGDKKTPQDKYIKKKVLKWRIPTELRPKKVKKSEKKTQVTIPSVFSRNSSMIFQTPKTSIASPIQLEYIACTCLSKRDVDVIKVSIQHLGTFTYHTKVEPSTKFLVTKSQPDRTLNMLFAMAFGCFIISEEWVHESYKIGRWLPYQQYLISDLSEPVKEFQIRRQTFGSLLTFHIFDDAGIIYISDTCKPSAKHLKRLLRSCGGQCTNIETMANVVVGYTPQMNNNISEKWILDCISQGTLLNKYQYELVNNNMT